ncbi:MULTISPECIES: competence type IV pilus minor pilin ComGD [unclassified Streptococcus]|uniref:competence type IV pilus minor pilin ComGD n=1 Tax=unclassified Streptococcus TaxID=2608887 RepID=UPI00359DA5D8
MISLLVLSLSGAVNQTFQAVQTKLFFMHFEHLYQDSQQLSLSQQATVQLNLSGRQITNGYQTLSLPEEVTLVTERQIEFSTAGGNSSLAKIVFQTKQQQVTYQLYIGSGKYKKTITSLHSP